VQRAKGAYLYDEDGNRLIDYINSWGPMILGHAFDGTGCSESKVGYFFWYANRTGTQIAALAVSMVPNVDKIRFVNSGTEACMSAVRLARGFAKKDKIIKLLVVIMVILIRFRQEVEQ
jgi:glutamate-1-semialdehyde 2,1-aminomutase